MFVLTRGAAVTLTVFVVSLGSSLVAQAKLDVRVSGPGAKVAITASATTEQLVLELTIDDGWHLYSRDVGGGQPVRVDIADGSSFAAAGALGVTPAAADGLVVGTARLTLPLKRVAAGGELAATFRYMVCDELMCLPPQEVRIASTAPGEGADPLSVLLVVTEQGDRSARIADFLVERGFRCTVATYPAVTLAQCDAHDVVVADSPYFSECRGMTGHARAFPKTASPIVAVGFLGTELVEAHGLAMTSGYI